MCVKDRGLFPLITWLLSLLDYTLCFLILNTEPWSLLLSLPPFLPSKNRSGFVFCNQLLSKIFLTPCCYLSFQKLSISFCTYMPILCIWHLWPNSPEFHMESGIWHWLSWLFLLTYGQWHFFFAGESYRQPCRSSTLSPGFIAQIHMWLGLRSCLCV